MNHSKNYYGNERTSRLALRAFMDLVDDFNHYAITDCLLDASSTLNNPRLQTLKPRIQVMKSARVRIVAGNERISDRSGGAWAKIRSRIMRRDRGLCQPCKVVGRVTMALQVDHIVALANGGGNDDGNLQGICHECHEAKTRMDVATLYGRA